MAAVNSLGRNTATAATFFSIQALKGPYIVYFVFILYNIAYTQIYHLLYITHYEQKFLPEAENCPDCPSYTL